MKEKSSTISIPLKWVRISLGIVYLWFGLLKFFPGQSPAEQLAKETIDSLFFHGVSADLGYTLLALWEVVIGVCFLLNYCYRPVLILFFLHLAGTFTPLVLLRSVSFHEFPYGFTLVGQYIMKNLVFVFAGWMIWVHEIKSKVKSESPSD